LEDFVENQASNNAPSGFPIAFVASKKMTLKIWMKES
jgi:hypothetical protein